jgi:hypothetical protein
MTGGKFYPGKNFVDITCPLCPAHHRQFVYVDIVLHADGWATWTEADGAVRTGYMGQGKCCGMPTVRPVRE